MLRAFLLWKEVKAKIPSTKRGTSKQPTIENQNPNMKTISLLAAIFLAAALAGPAAEAGRIPFNGTMEAGESYQDFGDPPVGFFVNATGTATTTLGQFTLVYTAIADLATGGGLGRARFIAPNGDSIFASDTATSGPTTDPNVFSIVETYTITGGTGRYVNAKGNFTLNRLVTFTGPVTGTTTGFFNGTIILKKHNH
jgi:hypothetical protein